MSRQHRILMCPPVHYGIHYEINPWMKVQEGSDEHRARTQWAALQSALESLGAVVELMVPVPGLPDLVFTANAGLVHGNRFLSSRFRFGVRQRETPHFEAWFQAHDFQVESLPDEYFFEGAGDALFCGETLYAGYRFRSDARSHQWLGRHLGVEVLPIELVDPRFYHLDTCFCPIAEDAAIYYPGAFDSYGRSVLQAASPTSSPSPLRRPPPSAATPSSSAAPSSSTPALPGWSSTSNEPASRSASSPSGNLSRPAAQPSA